MNNVGPFWFPKFLRKLLSRDREINAVCRTHDRDYIEKPYSRLVADMNLHISIYYQGKVKRAYIYYYAVRIFGIVSWFISKESK